MHDLRELRQRPAPTPGSAALIVLVREFVAEDVLPHIHEPGKIVQSSLSKESEARLDAAPSASKRDR